MVFSTQKERLDRRPRGGALHGTRQIGLGKRVTAQEAVTHAVGEVHGGIPIRSAAARAGVSMESIQRRIADAYDPETRRAFYEELTLIRQERRARRRENREFEEMLFSEREVDRLVSEIERIEEDATAQFLEREIFRSLSGRTQDHVSATGLAAMGRDRRRYEPPAVDRRHLNPGRTPKPPTDAERAAAERYLEEVTTPGYRRRGKMASAPTLEALALVCWEGVPARHACHEAEACYTSVRNILTRCA